MTIFLKTLFADVIGCFVVIRNEYVCVSCAIMVFIAVGMATRWIFAAFKVNGHCKEITEISGKIKVGQCKNNKKASTIAKKKKRSV